MSFRSCIEQLILFPSLWTLMLSAPSRRKGDLRGSAPLLFPWSKDNVSSLSLSHYLCQFYATSTSFTYPESFPVFFFLSYLSVPLVYLALSLFLFADFDFSIPGSMKLHNLISKLKKWIKILEAKTKQLPKFFLIEEKCRFLSNFSAQTAEVEIPGEFLMPKPTHYYIKIAR